MIPVNLFAVLASTVVCIIIGSIWFGPLFGKTWMRTIGIDPENIDPETMKDVWKSYVIMAIGSFFMCYTLSANILFGSSFLQMDGFASAFNAAFWNWLGFVVPVSLGSVLWERRPWKFWFITAGYYLVALTVVAMILSYWK